MGKLVNMGEWGAHATTSMSGRESKRGWSDARKKARFIKGAVTHEIGHMLHSFADNTKFVTATMMPTEIPLMNAADPLYPEKVHVATINGQVIQALNAKNYKLKWTYARDNPGEVVAEVFTAIMHTRKIPKGLAAVYVAYGGRRSADIDAALRKAFGGPIPAINQPEDAIAIINQP